jgi:branched-chain amino acid transport system permease protein
VGFEACLDHVTDGTGEVAGRPIEVVERDDAGDPAKAVAEATDLIGQGVQIIAGSASSGVATQVAPLAEQNDVLFISGPAAGLGLGAALALTTVVGVVLPLLVGGVALRASGIAFSMVTLATAQVGSIIVLQDPGGLTGGEEGLAVAREPIPDAFIGVFNTVNKYWLALAYLALVYLVVTLLTRSRAGRVWEAIRENERRVEVLGLEPYPFKLLVFVLAGLLASLGGVVHLLLLGGSTPRVTTADFTLSLLVMVVLGGAGSRWGAVLGGVLYTYLDSRLTDLAQSPAVQDLPAWLRVPLSEPLFILGTLFVVVVFFVPGGIAGLVARLRERWAGRRRGATPPTDGTTVPGRAVAQLREAAGRGVGAGAGPRDGV